MVPSGVGTCRYFRPTGDHTGSPLQVRLGGTPSIHQGSVFLPPGFLVATGRRTSGRGPHSGGGALWSNLGQRARSLPQRPPLSRGASGSLRTLQPGSSSTPCVFLPRASPKVRPSGLVAPPTRINPPEPTTGSNSPTGTTWCPQQKPSKSSVSPSVPPTKWPNGSPPPQKNRGVDLQPTPLLLSRPVSGGYSCRSASIGSIAAARLAGYRPNTTPIDTEMKNASGIDHGTMIGAIVETSSGS